jgi:hypothetical protein
VVGLSARWWCISEFVQLGQLVAVHCGLSGAVDVDGFRTESGEACACIISGWAREGMWGAQVDFAVRS